MKALTEVKSRPTSTLVLVNAKARFLTEFRRLGDVVWAGAAYNPSISFSVGARDCERCVQIAEYRLSADQCGIRQ